MLTMVATLQQPEETMSSEYTIRKPRRLVITLKDSSDINMGIAIVFLDSSLNLITQLLWSAEDGIKMFISGISGSEKSPRPL